MRDFLLRIGAQLCERRAFETVEVVIFSATKWKVGDKTILDVAVMRADEVAKLNRQGRRDRDPARCCLEVVGRRDVDPLGGKHATHDGAGVETAHVVYNSAGLRRLLADKPIR